MSEIPYLQIEHGKDINAWQQQEKESTLSYTYFKFFLDLGPQRSLLDTVKSLIADDSIKSAPNKKTLSDYQEKHRWRYRADLFDRHELATQERYKAEQRREELRISLEEYADFQQKMGRGLSALAAKVLTKTTKAIDDSPDLDWDLDKASRFMSILNSTAQTASGLWSDSLGVDRLNSALQDMEAKTAMDMANAGGRSPRGQSSGSTGSTPK